MKKNASSKFKSMNAAALYTHEYGAAAYQAWLRREAEITELSKGKGYSVRAICRMREDSFRQMKAEGARWAAAKAAVKPVRAVLARIAA